jgi:two-component system KDP operon response regulator KdpE
MPDNESRNKILLIEDDLGLAEFIQYQLQRKEYRVTIATRGVDGLKRAYEWQPDLIILDIMMPEMDGWTVCQRLREISDVPIIFTTALGAETDIVRGLEMGADDYLVKPFGPKELIARIQAVMRRHESSSGRPRPYRNGRLFVDLETHEVRLGNDEVNLTPQEFKLLACLIGNEGKVLTHNFLLKEVWGPTYEGERQYLKLYMWYLRQKLEADPSNPTLLITERGVGYRLARAKHVPTQLLGDASDDNAGDNGVDPAHAPDQTNASE